MAGLQFGREGGDVHAMLAEVAAGQMGAGGPGLARVAEQFAELRGAVLGELAVGRQLAAPDVQQRRAVGVRLQQVVARHRRRRAAFVQQRAHAGIGPPHVGRRDGAGEVAAGLLAQVGDLGLLDLRA